MTKEQREAIEIIEKMIKSYIEADECGLSNNDFKYEIKAMQTLLSIIKEQEKEIERLTKQSKVCDRQAQQYFEQTIYLNKIIDLMAEYIANRDNDQDICTHQIAEWCEDEEDGVLIEVCRKCIKQYFERQLNSSEQF